MKKLLLVALLLAVMASVPADAKPLANNQQAIDVCLLPMWGLIPDGGVGHLDYLMPPDTELVIYNGNRTRRLGKVGLVQSGRYMGLACLCLPPGQYVAEIWEKGSERRHGGKKSPKPLPAEWLSAKSFEVVEKGWPVVIPLHFSLIQEAPFQPAGFWRDLLNGADLPVKRLIYLDQYLGLGGKYHRGTLRNPAEVRINLLTRLQAAWSEPALIMASDYLGLGGRVEWPDLSNPWLTNPEEVMANLKILLQAGREGDKIIAAAILNIHGFYGQTARDSWVAYAKEWQYYEGLVQSAYKELNYPEGRPETPNQDLLREVNNSLVSGVLGKPPVAEPIRVFDLLNDGPEAWHGYWAIFGGSI